MKYIVITTKHCDSFAMFDSNYDNFNIKDGSPYGKDILEQLSRECKKQDMKLGVYYSHVRDWAKDDSARNSQVYLDSKVRTKLKSC